MKRYRITPELKKSSVEVQEFYKGDQKVTCTTVWRYAIFECEMDRIPVLLEGQDIYETLDNVEFIESADGDEYYDYSNMTEEQIAEVQKIIDDGCIWDIEENGWIPGDNTWTFDCPVEIEEIV